MKNLGRIFGAIVGSLGFLLSLPLFLWPLIGINFSAQAIILLSVSMAGLAVGVVCIRYIEGFKGWKGPVVIGVLFPAVVFSVFFVLMFALESIFQLGSKGFEAAIISMVIAIILVRKLVNYVRKNYA